MIASYSKYGNGVGQDAIGGHPTMTDQNSQQTTSTDIELTNGETVSLPQAVACSKFLETCLNHDRPKFDTLLALAGIRGSANHAEVDDLRSLGVVGADSNLGPVYRNVLSCSFLEVDSEVHLIEPYHADRDTDRDRWVAEEARFERNLLRSIAAADRPQSRGRS
jgi:hypothetical protein